MKRLLLFLVLVVGTSSPILFLNTTPEALEGSGTRAIAGMVSEAIEKWEKFPQDMQGLDENFKRDKGTQWERLSLYSCDRRKKEQKKIEQFLVWTKLEAEKRLKTFEEREYLRHVEELSIDEEKSLLSGVRDSIVLRAATPPTPTCFQSVKR